TSDNVSVSIDGVIYLQVVDPQKSAYGISDYVLGAVQLAQTSLRSSIGRMALDKTFESREHINREVCSDLNAATASWGVKILRYEIRDLTPPKSIMEAMERQVKAEREKRAMVLQSEGEKQSKINIAEGQRAAAIALSEGDKMAQINRAEGEAAQILQLAQATAEGLDQIKQQLGGDAVAAAQLRLAEAYIAEFGRLAEKSNTLIIPADAASVGSMLGLVTGMLRPGEGLNSKA
ncbi:MAG: paraslipin, partial [Desulfovibrionaceae bacterium]|nr:paraslipin [Desulfovibrionaceae bacterium]